MAAPSLHRPLLANGEIKATWSNGKGLRPVSPIWAPCPTDWQMTGEMDWRSSSPKLGISSWYNHYRENGLCHQVLAAIQERILKLDRTDLLRTWGLVTTSVIMMLISKAWATAQRPRPTNRRYESIWYDCNYRSTQIRSRPKCAFTMALKTGMSSPPCLIICFRLYRPTSKKHLFFHNGAHVYMNNWQSIDSWVHHCLSWAINFGCWIRLWTASSHLSRDNSQVQSYWPWRPLVTRTKLQLQRGPRLPTYPKSIPRRRL